MTAAARIAAGVAIVVLLNALLLLGFSELLGSFTLDGPGAALEAALALGLINGAVLYAATQLGLPLGAVLLGGCLLVIDVAALVIAGFLIPNASIGLIAAIATSVGMAVATVLVVWFFTVGEDEAARPPRSVAAGTPRYP
jgi:putative membrane protein